ncbi:unnamed protein product [Ceratitis capitata]|uniref:(Mediterranean fruit fly) hypothetical protein n=1 Tax=Ceratitis capitata TaxID=7213 RepID=A0A811V7T0_CERCA|nr:unnamed protein product [Ceratitis capitata]
MRLSSSNSNDSKPDNYQTNAKICRLVERYPCMYDRSHPHYLKKDVVDKAWVKISKEMDDSIPSCKERWRNIRTSFARSINVNKIPSSANRTKPYYLHEELQFLACHITPGIPVSRRPNYYTTADEKSEMIEVPIGEESFDGFVAMAKEEEEEQQQRINDESDSRQERAPSSSADESTQSAKGEPIQIAEEMHVDGNEQRIPVQNSPLPLLAQQPQPSPQPTQPQHLHQQPHQQQLQQHQQQQQELALQPYQQQARQASPIPLPNSAVEVEVGQPMQAVLPLYPFKKRLRPTEPLMYAEVEPERDIKPQPSELCQPEQDFDAAFLKGLLPEMKAMDFRQKIIFKKRIYEVIGEIFESTSTQSNGSATRRLSAQQNNSFNGSNNSTPINSNGFAAAAAYINGCTANNSSHRTTTPRPTPSSSPSASGYASPLNTLNSASSTTNTTTAMGVVNASDLAMIRRLSTLLQSPAIASSTNAMTALPKNATTISSTVRTASNTSPATVTAPMTPAMVSAHRGALTRSSANLLRTSMTNGGSAATPSSTCSSPGANSRAVKQELLDD